MPAMACPVAAGCHDAPDSKVPRDGGWSGSGAGRHANRPTTEYPACPGLEAGLVAVPTLLSRNCVWERSRWVYVSGETTPVDSMGQQLDEGKTSWDVSLVCWCCGSLLP